MIVLPEEEIRDFLAWSATYLFGIKPLTTFARVLTPRQSKFLLNPPQCLSLGRLETGWVGAIVGEALEASAGKIKVNELPVRNCLSSLLFAVARATALGLSDSDIDQVGSCWGRSRRLLGSAEDGSEKDKKTVCDVLRVLNREWEKADRPGLIDIVFFCRALMSSDNGSDYHLRGVEELLLSQRIILPNVRAAREDRIQAYEEVVRHLRASDHIKQPIKSFLVAFALSRVAPGSMEYIDLLLDSHRDFPTALVWYGLCAGLSAKTELLSQFDSLGRKVSKELLYLERPDGRPRCDLSFDELDVLMSGAKVSGWRSANPGQLSVEVYPSIYATFRLSPGRRAEQSDLFEGRSEESLLRDNEQQILLEELRSVLDQGRAVVDRLSPRRGSDAGAPSNNREKVRRVRPRTPK